MNETKKKAGLSSQWYGGNRYIWKPQIIETFLWGKDIKEEKLQEELSFGGCFKF